MTHAYVISGMSCQSCVKRVTAALEGVAGIRSAVVTLDPPKADVEMDQHISIGTLNEALARAGDYHLSEADRVAPVDSEKSNPPETLYPLFLIVGYIAGAVALIAIAAGDRSVEALMTNFMAGFFLVFSFFKLLDLRGFADAYRSYDVLARPLPVWGFIYPFVELALGVAYLLRLKPVVTNGVTLVVMLVSSAGVLKTLLDKRAIRCACLGTVLKLPMTKVTLVEDLGMAAMAGAMLVLLLS